MKKSSLWLIFSVCTAVFLGCLFLCLSNLDVLEKKPFQQTTSFLAPAMAKFEKDGNLYVIDNGSFRLVCLQPDGDIRYTIEIDKFDEYIRIIDGAIDDSGNLYIYAIEAEYDALLTKRDIIRKYDNNGNYVKDILSIDADDIYTNPRLFYQFGSFRCEDGILTFSQTEKEKVTLYMYDTYRDHMRSSSFSYDFPSGKIENFYVAQLVLKDMDNFAYVLRDGDIYEVINGEEPVLRSSFNWSMDEGGIIPWYIFYDDNGKLVFFDMASNSIFRILSEDNENTLQRIVPQIFFNPLLEQGEPVTLKGFGFYGSTFAGVFGETVWMYDGRVFTSFDNELQLPIKEKLRITLVQISLVLGILSLIAGLCILFIGILNFYVSLFVKQTVVIIPLLILAFIVVFTVTFNIMTERLNTLLFDEMTGFAVLSSQLIDGDDIDKITSIKDFHSDEYKRILVLIKEIIGYNADRWNRSYCAAIYKGNQFEYVVAISCEELNLFRPVEALEGEDYELFMSGKPLTFIFEESNGDWAAAEVPIYNSAGEIAGMFEIGLDMTGHEIGNANLKRNVALVVAAVCVIILLTLCILLSFIIKQLSAVGKVLHNIASGDRTARVSYVARDELGRVSHGLNSMAEELHHQFDRITRLNESTIRFVPVQFMEHLGVSDITKMKLGDNVQRDISVLFFDIRYFSVNSEMMTARENFDFINKILGIAGPIIRKHNGFVDKYIGDAAMALFVSGIDAVRAGIELYQTLVVDTNTKVTIGVDGINIGVGIHSGSVMMGIVGENERLSSTVISPNVNLASRIESLTKQTGSGVIITRDTLNQLAGHENEFAYRFIGMVQAAGVNEVIGLFDMLDALSPEDRMSRIATKEVFESGVRKYHMKDYATAVQRFEKVVKDDPRDICAMQHLEDAHKHLKNPGLASVFVFNKK
ncbi:MAG: HAMP domain-containing protein [Treponema sp.]|nr:HAMP domain-containing protein [Treponema sp.]MCL2251732.1 HAMP domain-containing protein [Treponema sp.]